MDIWHRIAEVTEKQVRALRVSFVKRIHARVLRAPSEEEIKRIENLRSTFRVLDAEWQTKMPTSQAAWIANAKRLQERVLKDDPRQFLRWDVIAETMFVSNEPFLDIEFYRLKESRNWKERWAKAVVEADVGCPAPFYLHSESSGNLIHQAYHLLIFEEKMGRDIRSYDLVVEFGGGYGSMCRLFFNQGFTGSYVLFDLPQFQLLQQFFLLSLNLPVRNPETFSREEKAAILCTSRPDDLGRVVDAFPTGRKILFIATWSLSEAPSAVRDVVLERANRFDGQLIAYQKTFQGIDNVGYFAKWKAELSLNTIWLELPIRHLPGNAYLFGVKR